MPTIHVEPGSDAYLQEIATAVFKSRKVVVITGAGISTNSGIPDFRSEDGLYSLIQAQYDAAAKDPTSENNDADVPQRSVEDERPAKRRRVSRDGRQSVSRASSEQPQQRDRTHEGQNLTQGSVDEQANSILVVADEAQSRNRGLEHQEPLDYRDALHNTALQSAPGQEHAPGPPQHRPHAELASGSSYNESARSRATLSPTTMSPRLSERDHEARRANGPLSTPATRPLFASSPPTLDLGPPDLESIQVLGSSPLSSPPPILFDPYQEYANRSSSPSRESSSLDSLSTRSVSEGPSSASTPLLTSQTSFASSTSRTSLPVLKGKDLFDAQIWSCPVKTSVFYRFATSLRQKARDAEPTASHHFVGTLRNSMKLVRCYTQNIDQLEERVGLSTSLELGAGSRYRFSARAGRSSGVAKISKEVECSTPASSQQDRESLGTTEASKSVSRQPPSDGGLAGNRMIDQKEVDDASADQTARASSVPPSTAPPSQGQQGPNRGVECVCLHGSLNELRCFQCGRTSPWDEEARIADTLAGRQPACPHCAGATAARQERGKRALGVGKLRPDIVLYGEEHPHSHLIHPIVRHDLSLGPDMLLILGTSMRVHGLKVLVKEFAKAVHDRGGKVVFVNFTKPPESVWADVIDFWIQWDCDAWVDDLRGRKPALWLLPGTTLHEDEKPKAAKAPRKSGGGDNAKRRESAKAAALRKKEGSSLAKVAEARDTILVGIGESNPSDDVDMGCDAENNSIVQNQVKQPPAGQSIVVEGSMSEKTSSLPADPHQLMPPPPKPLRAQRTKWIERKLNPDAKRPASIRDHRKNGAYLTIKILEDLHKLSGNPNGQSSAPTTPVAKPRPKMPRARKSAPAQLESRGEAPFSVGETPVAVEPVLETPVSETQGQDTQVPEAPVAEESTPTNTPETRPPATPIPAAPVMDDQQANSIEVKTGLEPAPFDNRSFVPTMPTIPSTGSIWSAVKTRKRRRVTWKMINGVETSFLLNENDEKSPVNTNKPAIRAPLPDPKSVLSHPTPLLPVHLPKLNRQVKPATGSRKAKPQPIEPQTVLPAPKSPPLPSNVGPPPMARFSPAARTTPFGGANPFGYSDPLLKSFVLPPRLGQVAPKQNENRAWNPEEQLRRDQEAAWLLEGMRRRRG